MSDWPRYIEMVERYEDMSPDGRLVMFRQEDGDVVIKVIASSERLGPASAAVEFTVPGSGGGQSPKTHMALLRLMEAIDDDNNESGQSR